MNIIKTIGCAVVLPIVLIIIFTCEKKNKNINSANFGKYCDNSVAFISCVLVAALCLKCIVKLITCEDISDGVKEFIDTGLPLAISLLLVGLLVNLISFAISKSLKSNVYKMRTAYFLVSCLFVIIYFIREKAYMEIFSFVAIILGRFVWFDFNGTSIFAEIKEIIFELNNRLLLSLLFVFLSITLSVAFGDIYTNCGLVIGWVICLLYLRFTYFRLRKKQYSNNCECIGNIRQLTKDDIPALSDLYYVFWNEDSDIQSMNKIFDQITTQDNYIILVAEKDGNIIGTVMGVVCYELYGNCRPFLVVENLVVNKEFRRLGIATRLIEELEIQAQKRNCSQMILVTEMNRFDACSFYENIGFSVNTTGYKKKL